MLKAVATPSLALRAKDGSVIAQRYAEVCKGREILAQRNAEVRKGKELEDIRQRPPGERFAVWRSWLEVWYLYFNR